MHVKDWLQQRVYVCQDFILVTIRSLLLMWHSATAGLIHSRPEPLYFYFYFWFINSIWIVVPALVICYSAGHINQRVAHAGAAKKLQ